MSTTLPPSWAWVTVDDLVASPGDLTDGPFGSNLKTEHYRDLGPRVIRLQNVGDGRFLDDEAHISEEHFARLRKHQASPGDVVVAMLGSDLPRACLVPPSLGPAIVKADCVRLRPDSRVVDGRYVAAVLNSRTVRRQAEQLVHGVGRPRLGLKWFRDLRIPLAPPAEQLRLVDAIDSHLSRLDAGVASLEAAQRKLKAYRASLLKAAVEGRLVPTEAAIARAEGRSYEPGAALLERILKERRRRWEEAELAKMKAVGKAARDDRWKAKYSDPEPPDVDSLPELPEGWCWTRLDAVSDVQLGQQRAPIHAASSEQLPYIRAANITWDGLDIADVKTMGFPNPDRYRLMFGDVLLSEASGSPMEAGKPAIWRDEVPGACYQKTLLRVRAIARGTLLPEYLRLVFLRDCVTGKFAAAAPGVGIVHLTAERMVAWPIPIAPLAEQERIVDEFEHLETVRNAARATVEKETRRIHRLRQSLLAWALGGKLVDQDPADESADMLLARVRAARAAATPVQPKAKRSRRLRAAS